MQNIRQTNVKKMNEIEEKLNYITQAKVNNIKDEAFERVSKRIYQVEKIMNQQIRNQQNEIREMKENLKTNERKYQQNKARRQFSKSSRMAQVQKLKKKLVHYLYQQGNQTKENQSKMNSYFQSRVEELNLAINREIQKRKQYFKNLDNELATELPQVNLELKKGITESSQRLEKLQKQVNQQAQLMQKKVKEAEKRQQSSYEDVMKMMSSVISEIKSQLQVEKQERVSNKEKLVKLFEDTHLKLSDQKK